MMKKIAAVLTVFNRKAKTVACLRHLFAASEAANRSGETSFSLTVFLTDDGCTDGTPEAVMQEFGSCDLRIVRGDGSLYWAGGMRKAWQAAIDSGTPWDYFLLINDDTSLYGNAFPQLFEAIGYGYRLTGRYGMASGITCQPGNPGEITYGGLNFVNKTRGRQELVKPTGTPQPIDMTHANILLVHSSVVAEIGIFHKGFLHSGADQDYGMTAARHGLPVYSTALVCGECEHDHFSEKEEAQQLMRLSLSERKEYVSSPVHNDRDYLLLVRRNMTLRYPMARLMRAIRLYFPSLYFRITNLRGVYKTPRAPKPAHL